MRPLRYIKSKSRKFEIQNLIIETIINEVLDEYQPTEYEKILGVNDGYGSEIDVYRFKTSNNNSYDVDFMVEILDPNLIKLDNDEILSDYFKHEYNNILKFIDLGFTPTEIKNIDVDDDIIGTMNDPYINKTNRNEQYEVLSKVAYLVKEYIKNNPQYPIYSIGKNTHENNLNAYIKLFKNLFDLDYVLFEGRNRFYKYGSYYFIDKKILRQK
jgi:hypothetical protein